MGAYHLPVETYFGEVAQCQLSNILAHDFHFFTSARLTARSHRLREMEVTGTLAGTGKDGHSLPPTC